MKGFQVFYWTKKMHRWLVLSLKWNNIYWIETVTPNSGFLYPTTYNLKGNHSNNIISIIHNTYVDYCRNNILFSLINLLILIHCIRYQYLLLQIIRKLRDHFRTRGGGEEEEEGRRVCRRFTGFVRNANQIAFVLIFFVFSNINITEMELAPTF